MDNQQITDLIKSQISFVEVTALGAHSLKCPVCKDDKVRAAFFFEHDHIGYHCFRAKCSLQKTKWVFSERIPVKFKDLMQALNIQIPTEILLEKKCVPVAFENLDETLYKIPDLTSVELPADFERYVPEKHPDHAKYISSRGMDDSDYFVSTEGSTKDMLIVPFYLNKNLYGYQGRSITKKQFKSQGNCAFYVDGGVIKDNCIVVEGIWDAKSVPFGVAILHDSVNPMQAYILRNHSPILLPDKDTSKFLDVAKKYGWRVCIPNWDCKDANEALLKYGRLVVARMIHDGICNSQLEAEIKYKMWGGG